MISAPDLIKDILNDIGIENKLGIQDESIMFKLDDMCVVEVYKHPVVPGYGIKTTCEHNSAKASTLLSRLDSMQLSIKNDIFRLTAPDISVSTKIESKPPDYVDGSFSIKCDHFGECSVKKYTDQI